MACDDFLNDKRPADVSTAMQRLQGFSDLAVCLWLVIPAHIAEYKHIAIMLILSTTRTYDNLSAALPE